MDIAVSSAVILTVAIMVLIMMFVVKVYDRMMARRKSTYINSILDRIRDAEGSE